MFETEILKTLSANGFKAYFVGGCVRDFCRRMPPNDFDVATSATPDKIKQIFAACKLVCAGEKHGTIGIIGKNGEYAEVTSFRTESTYSDLRHPDKVSFTDRLEEDLSRRDFTCNAMAMDANGNIIDLFGGQEDIKNKIIRCVGDAEKRFCEDALRILRAVRFAAQCDFEIEANTLSAANKLANNLSFVSGERIFAELNRTLSCPASYKVLAKTLPVFLSIFPSLKAEHWDKIVEQIRQAKANPLLALACILQYCDFYKELKELKSDNKTKNTILFLLTNTLKNETDIRKKIGVFGFDNVLLLGSFISVTADADTSALLDKILSSKDKLCSVSQLAISGNDVKALGIKGKSIALALDFLLTACIEGKCANNRTSLLKLLGNSINMLK